ncbi:MAG: ParB/RepB/Spo0J family partition protein [Chloroflexota bacterium]|nr:ParB/RepB/Spo0J family partition protein [Chloroflexota bacterium]
MRRPPGGLGRGLSALIPTMDADRAREIALRDIVANPDQPRQRFDEESLASLAASIAEHGVLQPVLVTHAPGGYQLVAGERRFRAAQMAGLERIPAIVRTVDQQQRLALALVENLQRTDLNAIDEARAFRRLADEFGLTQEEIGARMGRSRPAIANTLRLLDASAAVQEAVEDGRISEGHARAITALDSHEEQHHLLQAVTGRALSVRQTEALARRLKASTVGSTADARGESSVDPDIERLEAGLRAALGTKVTLSQRRRGGRITIDYYDDEDLGRLYERLAGSER